MSETYKVPRRKDAKRPLGSTGALRASLLSRRKMEAMEHGLSHRNARFWVWANGSPVKLTVCEGRPLCWHTTELANEGYPNVYKCWVLKGDSVTRTSVMDNGRMANAPCITDICPMGELEAGRDGRIGGRHIAFPDWSPANHVMGHDADEDEVRLG